MKSKKSANFAIETVLFLATAFFLTTGAAVQAQTSHDPDTARLSGHWMMVKSISYGYENKAIGTLYNFKPNHVLELIVHNELFSTLKWNYSDKRLVIEGKEEKYDGPVTYKQKDHIVFNYKFHYIDETGEWAQTDGVFEFMQISMPPKDQLVTASFLQAAWTFENKDKIIFYSNGSVRKISPDKKEKSAYWGLAGNLLEAFDICGRVKIGDNNKILWDGVTYSALIRDLSDPPIFVKGATFSAPDEVYIEASSEKIMLTDKPDTNGKPIVEAANGDVAQIMGIGPKQTYPNIGEHHYYLIKIYEKKPAWIYGAFLKKQEECYN